MRKGSSFRVLLQKKIGIKWVDWEGVRRNRTWKERGTRKAGWRWLAGQVKEESFFVCCWVVVFLSLALALALALYATMCVDV